MSEQVDNIEWEGDRQYISAESFVRLWQTSSTVEEMQTRIGNWLKSSGWLEEEVAGRKKTLANAMLRLAAYDEQNLESDHLSDCDVAALTGKKIQTWGYYSSKSGYEVLDVGEQRARIEKQVEHARKTVEWAEKACLDPAWSGYTPSSSRLKARATRFRSKHKIPLQLLRESDKSKLKPADKWKMLRELAAELDAA